MIFYFKNDEAEITVDKKKKRFKIKPLKENISKSLRMMQSQDEVLGKGNEIEVFKNDIVELSDVTLHVQDATGVWSGTYKF